MLSPADTAQSLVKGLEHKVKMPIVSIIFLSIMAGGSIAMGDIFGPILQLELLKHHLLVSQTF